MSSLASLLVVEEVKEWANNTDLRTKARVLWIVDTIKSAVVLTDDDKGTLKDEYVEAVDVIGNRFEVLEVIFELLLRPQWKSWRDESPVLQGKPFFEPGKVAGKRPSTRAAPKQKTSKRKASTESPDRNEQRGHTSADPTPSTKRSRKNITTKGPGPSAPSRVAETSQGPPAVESEPLTTRVKPTAQKNAIFTTPDKGSDQTSPLEKGTNMLLSHVEPSPVPQPSEGFRHFLTSLSDDATYMRLTSEVVRIRKEADAHMKELQYIFAHSGQSE